MIRTRTYSPITVILLIVYLALMTLPVLARAENGLKTDCVQPAPIGSAWETIQFHKEFDDPVIICSVISQNNTTPVTAFVRGVGQTSCELKLKSTQSEPVVPENLDVFIFEKGNWPLAHGGKVETLKIGAEEFNRTPSGKYRKTIQFRSKFKNPVVAMTVEEASDETHSIATIYNLTSSSVLVQLEPSDGSTEPADDVNVIITEKGLWFSEDGHLFEARVRHEDTPAENIL